MSVHKSQASGHWATTFCMVVPNIVGPRHAICFMSPFWKLEFLGYSHIFGKLVQPCSMNFCKSLYHASKQHYKDTAVLQYHIKQKQHLIIQHNATVQQYMTITNSDRSKIG
jgi:hypothetical protein